MYSPEAARFLHLGVMIRHSLDNFPSIVIVSAGKDDGDE